MRQELLDISVKLMSAHASGMMGLSVPKKHCSSILLNNEVVAVGFNRFKTSQIAYEFGYIHGEYHAELDALIQVHGDIINHDRSELTLINFRVNRFSNVGISRPCAKCMRWAHGLFGTFVYTDVDGGIVMEDTRSGKTELLIGSRELRKTLGWKEEAYRV